MGRCKKDHAEADSRQQAQREAVIKKVQSPQQYSTISIGEASLYFDVKPRTIHRWIEAGDLRSGARRGSITIDSILKLQRKRSRKQSGR